MSICRICKSDKLDKFLSLGKTPLANSFVRKDDLDNNENSYPLDVYFCNNCFLVQLTEIIHPEMLFKNYVYFSGVSQYFISHCSNFAEEIVSRFNLGENDLVVDIGGNDGTLLEQFKKRGTKVLNVDPATNVIKIAEEKGIKTVNEFWNDRIASDIKEKFGSAKIITGTNVFAHNDNLHDFVRGVKNLLSDGGVFIVEVPYLVDFMENVEFDTIYHEHVSYFSVMPLQYLFDEFDMKIFDVERVNIHGGTIRIYVTKDPEVAISENVAKIVNLEKRVGLDKFDTYSDFSVRVEDVKRDLLEFLEKAKNDGKKVIGYGAPAKGNTLLNYCKIDTDLLEYIVDKSPHKQGLYTPGMNIPVYNPDKIYEDNPDYILILAWNFAEEIMNQQKRFSDSGGKFVIPIPKMKVI